MFQPAVPVAKLLQCVRYSEYVVPAIQPGSLEHRADHIQADQRLRFRK